jgi:O-acetylhomoserine/O-acetylserine sulfhydrylase-like pyridoxal-dependent enzyme
MGCSQTSGFATRAVHAGSDADPATGARAVPIYQTNGFVFDDLEHGSDIFALKQAGFSYSRGANPTNAALERRIASLEGGTVAIACGSGQAALLMIIAALCATGDSIVAATHAFGGSIGLMNRMDSRYGVKARYIDPHDLAAVEAAIDGTTRGLFIESIINPTGELVDIPALSAVARRHRIPLVVDNTMATPALLRPIEHGADIVWHSASKYISGSGTVIGGLIVDAGSFDWAGDQRFPLISEPWADYDGIVLTEAQPRSAFAAACRLVGLRELGPGLAPTAGFLILTGCETLPLRMARHAENGVAVARHLSTHHAIADVSHPAVGSNSQRALIARLCPYGVGSVFTATLKGGREAAEIAIGRLKLFSHLVNVGETRSLVAHPETTTHRNASPAMRAALGVGPGTLRLSIGIENAEDLIADLDQALA